ncbi:hypothetical protein G5I_10104 [Acromyrmex echinatior]|uniref:Uncharacterized protein n=1 Tax=Acromyrmex echinatior TaxID=103372 RepID=F4WW70_ACREC|nr:hypothetical protein G5I_10104 [Acromyrmex echinatior]
MTADEMEMTDNDGDQRITVLFLTTFHDAQEVALSISSAFPCAKRDERSAYERAGRNVALRRALSVEIDFRTELKLKSRSRNREKRWPISLSCIAEPVAASFAKTSRLVRCRGSANATFEVFVCRTVIQQIVGSRSSKADTVSPSAAPPKLVLEFVPRKGHDNGRWALKFERYVPDSLNV